MSEVAEWLNVEPEEVLEAMEMAPAMTPVSLESTPGSGPDDDGGRQLSDALGGEDPSLDRVELRDLIERAMQHLTPRERAIMAMRFYDEMSQSEIAKRLGISQMHVSRLQRAALEQLRQYLPETAT